MQSPRLAPFAPRAPAGAPAPMAVPRRRAPVAASGRRGRGCMLARAGVRPGMSSLEAELWASAGTHFKAEPIE